MKRRMKNFLMYLLFLAIGFVFLSYMQLGVNCIVGKAIPLNPNWFLCLYCGVLKIKLEVPKNVIFVNFRNRSGNDHC
jgi:hypothetical protein